MGNPREESQMSRLSAWSTCAYIEMVIRKHAQLDHIYCYRQTDAKPEVPADSGNFHELRCAVVIQWFTSQIGLPCSPPPPGQSETKFKNYLQYRNIFYWDNWISHPQKHMYRHQVCDSNCFRTQVMAQNVISEFQWRPPDQDWLYKYYDQCFIQPSV